MPEVIFPGPEGRLEGRFQPGPRPRAQPPVDDGVGIDGVWREADGEHRTTGQVDFDTLAAILTAGIHAEHDGIVPTRAIHEVVVHIPAADLIDRTGGGWAEGILTRLPIPSVEKIACTGGTRLLVTGEHGEPLHLGRTTRLFAPAQKTALAARDGGCAWPGCTAPIAFTDAHHIHWWHRDTGPTDIDNGILLCSHHHHAIHTTHQWQIRLHHHQPYLVPTSWTGPPRPEHRMQQHPLARVRDGTPRRI